MCSVEGNVYQLHRLNSESGICQVKCSVRAAGVKQDDTHTLLLGCVQQGERFRQRENRSHSRTVQGIWQTETISGTTFLTLTVLLLYVGLADRKYVTEWLSSR